LCTPSQTQLAATRKTRKKSRNQIIFKLRKNPGMKRVFGRKKSRNEKLFSLENPGIKFKMKAASSLPGGLT
jgi:hypothetical protein